MSDLTLYGALQNAVTTKTAPQLNTVSGWRDGWRRITEPFTGAWQRNIEEDHGTLLQYPTLYACVMRIATDIGKLPFTLMEVLSNGVWKATTNTAYTPVLRKPNGYQTAQQFREAWMLSKLIQGNTYGLKRRDNRGVVVALYILDPYKVMPAVTETGKVWYKLQNDNLNTLPQTDKEIVVPASEIIHDRCMTLHHWLIGVPPLSAAYWPAVKNLRILKSASEFFANNAQPGGILTAPAGMSDADADRLKRFWDENYTGDNAGKVAVLGADMKFTSFAMKGADSQLVEQMKYSDEQIAQPFGIPPFKIGIGSIPSGLGVDGVNQLYYADALQGHIEHMEALLSDGLSISPPLSVELDLEPLLRMDIGKQADVETKLVAGKVKTPDEARMRFNLAPTGGGDTIWGQHQDYPLGMLAKRNDLTPIAPPAPTTVAPEAPEPDQTDKAIALLWKRSPETFANV